MAAPVWVMDTSALIQIKSFVPHHLRSSIFQALGALVSDARLVFPRHVLRELRRDSSREPDQACAWALSVETTACSDAISLDRVKEVLALVPDILDHMKDAGEDEADPYVLALALQLKADQQDARIVVQEIRDSPRKLSLNTASGMLGIPSVPLLGLLKAEKIKYAD